MQNIEMHNWVFIINRASTQHSVEQFFYSSLSNMILHILFIL